MGKEVIVKQDIVKESYFNQRISNVFKWYRIENGSRMGKTINEQCFPSHRNHLIDLHCKSMNWFLFDGER